MVRRRDLIYLWLLAFAGLVLCNHQIITRLQLENNHWGNVLGPALSILLVLMVSYEAARSNLSRRWLQWGGVLLVCAEVWIGVQFRIWESLFSRQPIELQAAYQSYVQQRPPAQSPRLGPGSVVAGDELFSNWSVVLENTRSLKGSAFVSPSVNNANWTERVALNRFLEGVGPQAFEAEQRAELARAITGPWARDPQKRDQHLAELVAAYRAIEADPAGALRRLEVRYVALPAGQRAPACLKNGWQRVQAGPNWQIWDFSASSPVAR